nr:unnamed protein product [Callosobruchus chinensis]CAH7724521.1 unnamed protein product [Callosobruchus chinensis]CAH7737092.1 unnamed protein product [Callosobruchus chinensis]CAH7742699.1 unnamed protein product [Callosobruchus chinensis]
MIKELQSDMKELRRSVEFISEKYEEEKKRNKVVSDMLVEITKDNETLKQEVNRLKNVLQGDSTTPIYVDEELTKETYALFKKAKQLLREKGYKYVWHREGRILARIADGNNVIWVKNQTVLDSLLN